MAPPQPQPFLGVMTVPLPEPLAVQLSIPVGFGLIVGEVLPNSPAAQAGIQKFDVLRLLNDQQLVEPAQLQALVRAAGKDKEVTLTIVRKAQEQKVTVKVGERLAPVRPPFSPGQNPGQNPRQNPGARLHHLLEQHGQGDPRTREAAEERMRDAQKQMREHHERMRQQYEQRRREQPNAPQPNRGGERPLGEGRPSAAIEPDEILREAQPGGGNQIKRFTETSVTTLEGAKARLVLKDQDGEIEVAGENGKRTLTARDPQGQVVFTGPVDTAEQREAIPPAFREKLERIRLRTSSEREEGQSRATQAIFATSEEEAPDVQ